MNRILFAGTPEISVPFLRALSGAFNVVGVLTAPDKPQGRSSALVPPPVKVVAQELGIPVLQFDTIRTEAREAVSKLGADTLISFAFGKIFGPKFLEMFPCGKFNVHPSALPMFRGPSPIQATILNGLKTASVSLQEIGLKMDEGAIFSRFDFDLSGTETTASLTSVVSQKAAEFVVPVLAEVFDGKITAKAQIGEASYCSMLGHDDSKIDFNCSALEVHSKIRAMNPWPKATAHVSMPNKADGSDIFITGVWGGFEDLEKEPILDDSVAPGTVVAMRKDRGIGVACRNGVVWITSLQLPAKKELDFKSFANGNSWILKSFFS